VSEAPEICIEVMSPSNSWPEMMEKLGLYFGVGAREVWIVDTEGKVSFFGPGIETLAASGIIPEMPGSI
jgi:Uma2 family endonuclease